MKSVALNAFPRTLGRRGGAKKLRTNGRVPAVIYGGNSKPRSLELVARELEDLIHHHVSENILVDLAVEKNSHLALLQEVQHHPLNGKILHVDFHEVSAAEKVTIYVPVETSGEAVGVKTGGGILEHVLHKLRVRALPKDLPEQILIDVTALELGKAVHIGEIKAPEGVEILGEKKAAVVSVKAPRAEEEAAADAAPQAAGDVEMTKEKKEEGAEGAAPAKAGDKAAAPAKTDAKAAAAPAKDAKAAPAAEKKK